MYIRRFIIYYSKGEEGEKKFLETSYESLIRKHKIAAISLNQQITEVREEIAKWKRIVAMKKIKTGNKQK
uniref:Uncharacterized protein n=1 Tax=Glossina pallidipes TaxID=7398 RepID=A0A1A9ZQN9_GLOPL